MLAHKQYELTNHLGNVLATVQDRKTPVGTSTISRYTADVTNATLYYPFGSAMRTWVSDTTRKYKFGFNGQEKDDEVAGNGNSNTAEFWQYDSRLGRRWNVDPIYRHYQSNYSTFSNNPIVRIDPNGKSDYYTKDRVYLGSDGTDKTDIIIVTDKKVINALAKKYEEALAIDPNATYVNIGVQNLKEGQFFLLPPYEDRQEIKTAIDEVSYTDGEYYEAGGSRYTNANGDPVKFGPQVGNAKTLQQIGESIEKGKAGIDMPVYPDNALSVEYTWHLHTNKISYMKDPNTSEFMLLADYEFKYGQVNRGNVPFFGGLTPSPADDALTSETNFLFTKTGNEMMFYNSEKNIRLNTTFFFDTQAKKKPISITK